jgi:hypothetical protein
MNHNVCYYEIPLRHFELRTGMNLDMLVERTSLSRAQKHILVRKFLSLIIITDCYGIPVGIMNDIQSPVSPHSARYN